MLKTFLKYLNFENASKKSIRVPGLLPKKHIYKDNIYLSYENRQHSFYDLFDS